MYNSEKEFEQIKTTLTIENFREWLEAFPNPEVVIAKRLSPKSCPIGVFLNSRQALQDYTIVVDDIRLSVYSNSSRQRTLLCSYYLLTDNSWVRYYVLSVDKCHDRLTPTKCLELLNQLPEEYYA